VLEGELPTVRTYTYQINGALTPEQLADIGGLGSVKLTPVDIIYEEEVDKTVTIAMATNDVDDVPKTRSFPVTSGTAPGGYETKILTLTGVTFDFALPPDDKDRYGRPADYMATAVYRGVQTYAAPGYYMAEATFTTSEEEDGTELYVVVAEYRTDEIPPPIDEGDVITPVPEPEAAGGGTIDEELIALQGPNPIQNLIDGLVPLGGTGITGFWSFLSLLFSFAAIGMAAAFAIGAAMRQRRMAVFAKLGVNNEEELAARKRRGVILRILAIVFGVVTLVSWLFLENFSYGMVWVNNYTPVIGVLFAATVVLSVLTNIRSRKDVDGDAEETEEDKRLATEPMPV
jgi:TRAP-type C4-dicarboxylate transport system permease small subunit